MTMVAGINSDNPLFQFLLSVFVHSKSPYIVTRLSRSGVPVAGVRAERVDQ